MSLSIHTRFCLRRSICSTSKLNYVAPTAPTLADALQHPVQPGYLHADHCDWHELDKLVHEPTELSSYPFASEIKAGVLIYDCDTLPTEQEEPGCQALQAEMAKAFLNGPGIVVIRGAIAHDVVDRVTAVFDQIIADEAAAGQSAGDHFAKVGTNQRIWNALEKLAVADPAAFVEYYSNSTLAMVSRAWLGPAYQVTSQVNVVLPGGAAQAVHRDYHLGFCTDAIAQQFPAHVHTVVPQLTLQGAVAHCDMPCESGPTLLLPHSQKYEAGYLAWRRDDFKQHFQEHHIQLPLSKGDMLFFNPAVFHAAGDNISKDIRRIANLLQVSSAFGRAMETVDRLRMSEAVFPSLRAAAEAESWTAEKTSNAIAACAEGYSFPTNLDSDPPSDTGLAPMSQAQILQQAITQGWDQPQFEQSVRAHHVRTLSH